MTRRRWIADEVSGDFAVVMGEHADHLVRVLRARVGQEFDIATGTTVRRGSIVTLTDTRVEFALGEEVLLIPTAQITLVLAIFKFDRMEWAIEKCTELGVARILPVITRRSDSHLVAASAKRVERWRRIALQASEQSRRIVPPEIASPAKLAETFKLATGLRIVLAENEDEITLKQALQANTGGCETALAVGPEGGWSEEELQAFQKAGWIAASLGTTILRAETAAIAATAIGASALST